MSRDLKQEYEEMLDQEIPDLWSRIEPRLADKKETQNAEQKEKTMPKRRIKRSTIAVLGSLAAACVCLAIILPAWRGNQKGFASDQMMVSDGGTDTNAGASNDSASLLENSTMNGMAQPEAACDDAASSSTGEPEEADGSDFTWYDKEDSVQTDEAEIDYGADIENAATAPEKESDQDVEAEKSLLSYECYGEIVDAWQTREGFFYHMELIGGGEESVPDETEILIWQKAGFLSGLLGGQKAALTTGIRYTVIVETEIVDGETRYVLIDYEADD